jgi:hypothetical protein
MFKIHIFSRCGERAGYRIEARHNTKTTASVLFVPSYGTLCLDKLKDTGGRENHGRDGLTASRKQPAYDWKT